MAIAPGFFFGFIIWSGIILYFQKGDEGEMESGNSNSQADYIDELETTEMSWTTKLWYDPAESMFRGIK